MGILLFGNNKDDFLSQNDSLPPGVFYSEDPMETKGEERSIFLLGDQYEVCENDRFLEQLKIYAIKKGDFNIPLSTTHFIIESGKIKKRYLYQRSLEGLVSAQEIHVSKSESEIELPEIETKELLDIDKGEKGNSYLGGDCPVNFARPQIIEEVYANYIGMLSNRDSQLSWLPFEFHIIHPLKISCDRIYYDYSNPMEPKVIDNSKISIYSTYDNIDLNKSSLFPRTPIIYRKRNGETIGIGEINIPEVQFHFDLPKCPISQQAMQYVTSLRFTWPEKFINAYTELNNIDIGNDLESIGFADMGSLEIFICMETKAVCYIPIP